MNIAVIDVAAEKSGALTVLNDFIAYICEDSSLCAKHKWFVYTSMQIQIDKDYITNIVVPEAKQGRLKRLIWDRHTAIKEFNNKKIDLVISLQNAAFKKGRYKQVAYFHNVLLLNDDINYSLFKKSERNLAIYTKIISKYTLSTLKNVEFVACQTDTVKKKLESIDSSINAVVVRPNIKIEKKYRNCAILPIKSLVYPTVASEYKRIEDIISCVQQNGDWFKENNIEVVITINGDENEYAKRVFNKGIEVKDTVKFVGKLKRDDLLDLYKNSALIISSCRESFPMPFLEAAYIGIPIIAAKYDYAIDCLKDFGNTFLYEPGKTEQLFSSIQAACKVYHSANNMSLESDNSWKKFLEMAL